MSSGACMMMGNAYPPMSVASAPSSVSGSDSGSTVTSNSATTTVTGGSGSFSHSWAQVSGDASIDPVSASAATTTFQASGMSPGGISGGFVDTVTDLITGQVLPSNTVNVYLERSNPPLSVSTSGSGVKTQTSSGTITVTSDGVTLVPAGGVPPYSYSHAHLTANDFSINSAGSAASTHSRSLGPGGGVSGTVRGTVTDSLSPTPQTAFVDYGVVLINDGTAPPPLEATADPTYVSALATEATVTTDSTSVSVTGGTAASHAWVRLSGVGSINSPSSATTTFTHVMAPGTEYGTFQCTVTDTLGRTDTVIVSAEFARFEFIP
ncbi:hypothetical protein [Phenylobacterium sp.]|uniref:hypothetical protein n=1 Tax=Phenylobacterium sp. TaxID=1871053 RepID=UPI002737529A|nr:hypothetical protein [Phenylobacterium sp.]MDP3853613.1 hypothetical protein [Phenylobacterium sp.]